MLRRKLALIGVTAAFGASAVGASTAHAECPDAVKGGDVSLCIQGKEVSGNFPFKLELAKEKTWSLEVTNGPDIVCAILKTANNEKGEFDAGDSILGSALSISELTLEMSVCKVSNAEAKCEVPSPVIFDGGGDSLEGEFAGEETKSTTFAPSSGTLWGKVSIKSKPGQACAFAAVFNVDGKQVCKLPLIGAEEKTHEVECIKGSELTFGGKGATMNFVAVISLLGAEKGKNFSIQAS